MDKQDKIKLPHVLKVRVGFADLSPTETTSASLQCGNVYFSTFLEL